MDQKSTQAQATYKQIATKLAGLFKSACGRVKHSFLSKLSQWRDMPHIVYAEGQEIAREVRLSHTRYSVVKLNNDWVDKKTEQLGEEVPLAKMSLKRCEWPWWYCDEKARVGIGGGRPMKRSSLTYLLEKGCHWYSFLPLSYEDKSFRKFMPP